MLNIQSRFPIKRQQASTLIHYKVKFEEAVSPDDLFKQVCLVDTKNKRTVRGTVHGVECSTGQDKHGIQPGEYVVIAIWPDATSNPAIP